MALRCIKIFTDGGQMENLIGGETLGVPLPVAQLMTKIDIMEIRREAEYGWD